MNSYNPFAHQIQLNLNTGEPKQVNATGVTHNLEPVGARLRMRVLGDT